MGTLTFIDDFQMEAHSIVIGDTHTIADFPAYITYW